MINGQNITEFVLEQSIFPLCKSLARINAEQLHIIKRITRNNVFNNFILCSFQKMLWILSKKTVSSFKEQRQNM